MCTLFYHKPLGILAKNRDKNVPTEEEIVRTENVLAVRTKGADYFGLGVNVKGCAFVSAAINSPKWTREAESGNARAAAKIFAEENAGLISPSRILSESLDQARDVSFLIKCLEDRRADWMGYNLFIIDPERGIAVETYRDQMIIRDLDVRAAVTNHFMRIEAGPVNYHDYPSSYDRLSEAEQLLSGLKENELADALGPGSAGKYPFWRDDNFFTLSSSLIHYQTNSIAYLARGENQYRRLAFDEENGGTG